jgi:hypothetical protein
MDMSRRLHRTLMGVAIFLFVVIGGIMLVGCEDKDPLGADGIAGPAKSPAGNEPPETHLSLTLPPGVLPDTSRSSKTLNWWGEDLDGRVVSYEYRWGKVEEDTTILADTTYSLDTLWYDEEWEFIGDNTEPYWISTTEERVDFILPIRSRDALFTAEVRAVDNDGVVDPTPSTIAFPIINSKPSIEFRDGSNPGPKSLNPEIIDTTYTFPVRTFVWDASDPDGNESIEKVLYALDPLPGDTIWQEIAGNESSVTLTDLEPGTHVFWVKVVDVAGFESNTVNYPNDSLLTEDPDYWMVKSPAPGRFLIVDDYAQQQNNNTLNFYKSIIDSIYNDGVDGEEDLYSVWELIDLPYATTDVTQTLMMFDQVLWYTYRGTPLLTGAFSSMETFINAPGNQMLLTTSVVVEGTEGVDQGMLLDIASAADLFSTRFGSSELDPVFINPVDDLTLPSIFIEFLINSDSYGLTPLPGAEIIYQLDISTSEPPQYEGTPIVGLRRADKSYTLMTVPMHLFGDTENVGEIIHNTFGE